MRLGLVFLLGCGGVSEPADTDADDPVDVETTLEIASGELVVKAAEQYEDEGFHMAFAVDGTVPENLASSTDLKLVVRLWEESRPDQTCEEGDHPLYGCVTVDWSDAIGRPHVPDDGVFDNRVTFELDSGSRDFFLSETLKLKKQPDDYSPT